MKVRLASETTGTSVRVQVWNEYEKQYITVHYADNVNLAMRVADMLISGIGNPSTPSQR